MTFSDAAVGKLADGFGGDLIGPQDERFEEARKIWNGGITKRPGIIARPSSEEDVVAAVRFAADQGVELSVKGGGHAVAGHALTDGGLMLDLGPLNAVTVDAASRTAKVGGGSLWSDVDTATQDHGLATTGGVVSHTGVGGLTLGGGIGHLMRKCGLTIDNLLECRLVTASGEILTVNEDTEPELFWGLKGGGGNFGVVTEFTFKLHEVGPEVLAGGVIWPLEQGEEVLRFYRDWVAEAPNDLGAAVNFRLAPPMPFIPEQVHGKPVLMMLLGWWGDHEQGEEALRPMRQFGSPAADVVMPKPYVAHQSMVDASVPHGLHYYWKAAQLPGFTDSVIGTILKYIDQITSPLSQAPVFQKGGIVRDVPEEAAAFGARQAELDINVVGTWTDGDPEFDRHVQWSRDFYKELESETTGTFYVNFISDEGDAAVEAAYGTERLKRLTVLKERYDPQNLFHLNHNIVPGAG